MPTKAIRDDWRTPEEILVKVRELLGNDYDDPCPADYWKLPEEDGLIRSWGERCFINPPYSRGSLENWTAKALKDWKGGKTFLWLVNYGCTKNRQILFEMSDLICIPFQRIKFVHPNPSVKVSSNDRDQVFCLWSVNREMHDGFKRIFSEVGHMYRRKWGWT